MCKSRRSRRQPGRKPGLRRSYPSLLRRSITPFLPDLRLLPLGAAERWVPRYVALVAVLMALGVAGRRVDRFCWARAAVGSMFPTRRRPGKSVQGFNTAWAGQSAGLLERIIPALRRAVIDLAGPHWRSEGFVLIGVDGSRFECPMTRANEDEFGTAGKDKTGPQQFLTTAFHAGTGLVWDWRRGDARASERETKHQGTGLTKNARSRPASPKRATQLQPKSRWLRSLCRKEWPRSLRRCVPCSDPPDIASPAGTGTFGGDEHVSAAHRHAYPRGTVTVRERHLGLRV